VFLNRYSAEQKATLLKEGGKLWEGGGAPEDRSQRNNIPDINRRSHQPLRATVHRKTLLAQEGEGADREENIKRKKRYSFSGMRNDGRVSVDEEVRKKAGEKG